MIKLFTSRIAHGKMVMKTPSMTNPSKKMASILITFCAFALLHITPLQAQDKGKKDEKKDDKKKIVEPYVVKRLTQGIYLYSLGTLSPDKKQLAFVAAKQSATPNLYIMNVGDFSISPPLTSLKWGATEPQWSPD